MEHKIHTFTVANNNESKKKKSEKGSKVRQIESQIIKPRSMVEWKKKKMKKTFNLMMKYKCNQNEMKHFLSDNNNQEKLHHLP